MDAQARRRLIDRIPAEVTTVLAVALAIFGVVSTGGAISAALDRPSPWLFAAAYGGPASIASAVYWLLARRLPPPAHPGSDAGS